jgi:transcriptional regulator with XRE-family HTH domain
MNEQFTETNAQNLASLRKARGLRQQSIADVLGLEKSHISKIENGVRDLSSSEKTVLDWFFFGITPQNIVSFSRIPNSTLDFSPEEWRIISIVAKRNGLTEREWIVQRIREHLALLPEKQLSIVADDSTDYRTKSNGDPE